MQNLFIYGTLLYPQVWNSLIRRTYRHAEALLSDHKRLAVRGEEYPGLVACQGATVSGVVYFGIHAHDMRRLDRYEGDEYERKAVVVQLNDGTPIRAVTYIFKRQRRNRLLEGEWRAKW